MRKMYYTHYETQHIKGFLEGCSESSLPYSQDSSKSSQRGLIELRVMGVESPGKQFEFNGSWS